MILKDKRTIPIAAIFLIVGCFMMTAVGNGLTAQPRGLYINPITQELGFSRSLFSTAYSVVAIMAIPITANIGWIRRKLGSYRVLVFAAFLGNTAGLIAAAFGQNLIPFYFYALCIQIGAYVVSTTPVTGLITNWFTQKQGLLLGIISAGSSMGGSFWSYLTGIWIESFGWRNAFLISAACMGAIGLLVFLMVRDFPKGVTPPAPAAAPAAETPKGDRPPRTSSIWKNRNAIFLGLAGFCVSISFFSVALNAAVMLQDKGSSTVESAAIFSRMLFFGGLIKVLTGLINDRFGLWFTRTVMLGSLIIGTGCMLFAGSTWAQWGFSIFFSAGYACNMMFLPIHATRYFTSQERDDVFGVVSVFNAFGVLLGSPAFNLYYEFVGNYAGALIICMAFMALSWVLYNRVRANRPMAPDAAPAPQ